MTLPTELVIAPVEAGLLAHNGQGPLYGFESCCRSTPDRKLTGSDGSGCIALNDTQGYLLYMSTFKPSNRVRGSLSCLPTLTLPVPISGRSAGMSLIRYILAKYFQEI